MKIIEWSKTSFLVILHAVVHPSHIYPFREKTSSLGYILCKIGTMVGGRGMVAGEKDKKGKEKGRKSYIKKGKKALKMHLFDFMTFPFHIHR